MFKEENYEITDNVITVEMCEYINTMHSMVENIDYFLNNVRREEYSFRDAQVNNCHSKYGAIWAESLLTFLQPAVERVVGEELFPTYSFTRVYYPGAEMAPHTDRDSCEITTSITIKYEGNNWPIFIEDKNNVTHSFLINQGSMLVFEGSKLKHWRLPYKEGTKQLQVFLHYIRKNGGYTDFKYDKRPMLGLIRV